MKIVAQFNPAATASTPYGPGGVFPAPHAGPNKLAIFNESVYNLQLWLPDGSTAYLPAWSARLICRSLPASAPIYWTVLETLAAANPPSSLVVVEAYEPSESVAEHFPAALTRQTNVGNTVSMSGGSAMNVVNDGQPAGTQVVEATASGDSVSSVSLDNIGNLVLGSGQAGHSGKITLGPPAAPGPGSGGLYQRSALLSTRTLQLVGLDTNGYRFEQIDDGGRIYWIDKNQTIAAVLDISLGALGLGVYPAQVNATSGGSGYLTWGMPFAYNDPNFFKMLFINLYSLKNGSSTITINLPVQFYNHVFYLAGDIPGMHLFNGANAVTTQQFNPGSTSPVSTTTIQSGAIGWAASAVTSLTVDPNNASSHSGSLIVCGF